MTDLTEQWVNIYKSKKYGDSYWTGTFCYKTKEEAVKNLADKENYLTTVNIEDMLNLQTQNEELKEILERHKKATAKAQIRSCDLEIINAQLKELLKECQYILKEQIFYRNTPVETDTTYKTRCLKKQELLTKIDEVLK